MTNNRTAAVPVRHGGKKSPSDSWRAPVEQSNLKEIDHPRRAPSGTSHSALLSTEHALTATLSLFKMRQRIIIGGQVALLSLIVVLALWYRDELAERFEPIQRLFPKPGEFEFPVACSSIAGAGARVATTDWIVNA